MKANEFLKNTVNTVFTRVMLLAFGMASSIVVARSLGAELKGVLALAILFSSLIFTFSNFGIGAAAVYYIGKEKYTKKEIFGANIVFSILISTLAILVGLGIIIWGSDTLFPGVSQNFLYLSLLILPLNITFSFAIEILMGIKKILAYNKIKVFQEIAYLVLIFVLLIGLKYGVAAAILSQVGSTLIVCVITYYVVIRNVGLPKISFNKALIKDFFVYGFKIYFTNVVSFLHLRVDSFMVNFFINPLAVGYYSIAVALTEKIWLVSQSAGAVLFPKVASEKNPKTLKEFTPMVTRNVLFITLIMIVGLLIVGDWAIRFLYSEEFASSVMPFYILTIGSLSISGSRILSNDLSGRGKLNENLSFNVISVILNIVLNIIMIPKYGITGAAIATSISYTCVFIIRLIIYLKISGNKVGDVVLIKKSDLANYKKFLENINLKRAG